MKKMLAIFISGLLLMSNFSVMAATVDNINSMNITDKADVLEIAQLYDDNNVQELIQMIIEENNIVFDNAVPLEWKDLIKVYSGTDIISGGSSDKMQILNSLNTCNYCYVTSVFYNDLEIEITFSKGNEVSDGIENYLTVEQYQEVVDNVDKWFLSSIAVVTDENVSIYDAVSNQVINSSSDYVVVGGQPGFWQPVVILFEENMATEIITIYDKSDYPILQTDIAVSTDTNVYEYTEVLSMMECYEEDLLKQGNEQVQINTEMEPSMNEVVPYATGNYKLLNVTKYSQEKSNWCWAASAQMLGKYYTGSKIDQSNIVYHVKGSTTVNETAYDDETRSAISYAVGSSYLVTRSGVKSYASLENAIYNKSKPFAIKVVWSGGGAHILVVSGVNGFTSDLFHLINPSASRPNAWYSYNALVNGATFPNDTGTYVSTFMVN